MYCVRFFIFVYVSACRLCLFFLRMRLFDPFKLASKNYLIYYKLAFFKRKMSIPWRGLCSETTAAPLHQKCQNYMMSPLVLYPPPSPIEQASWIICGHRRVAVTRHRMIVIVLIFKVHCLGQGKVHFVKSFYHHIECQLKKSFCNIDDVSLCFIRLKVPWNVIGEILLPEIGFLAWFEYLWNKIL